MSGGTFTRFYGCKFDPNGAESHRKRLKGFSFSRALPPASANPSHVDLRVGFPAVTEQKYNSCTAEALTAAYEYDVIMQYGRSKALDMSRLFVYYQERLIEGDTQQDQGAMIHSGVLSLMTSGICEEKEWPYTSALSARPPTKAYTDALSHKVINASLVDNQDMNSLKGILAAGHPIVVGILVYSSMESQVTDTTGVVPIPSAAEIQGQPLGGHAIVLVGYDDSKQQFAFRNSWGTHWGDKGYGYLPYQYVLDASLCQEGWLLTSVNDEHSGGSSPAVVPTPTPAPPKPKPKPAASCCDQCDPSKCCCARTRSSASVTADSLPVINIPPDIQNLIAKFVVELLRILLTTLL